MNSALQCLFNIPHLRQFMLSSQFLGEINKTNALGSKGAIVLHFAKLLGEVWHDKPKACIPIQLKQIIAKKHP